MSIFKKFLSALLVAYAIFNLYQVFEFLHFLVYCEECYTLSSVAFLTFINIARVFCIVFLILGVFKSKLHLLIFVMIILCFEIISKIDWLIRLHEETFSCQNDTRCPMTLHVDYFIEVTRYGESEFFDRKREEIEVLALIMTSLNRMLSSTTFFFKQKFSN